MAEINLGCGTEPALEVMGPGVVILRLRHTARTEVLLSYVSLQFALFVASDMINQSPSVITTAGRQLAEQHRCVIVLEFGFQALRAKSLSQLWHAPTTRLHSGFACVESCFIIKPFVQRGV